MGFPSESDDRVDIPGLYDILQVTILEEHAEQAAAWCLLVGATRLGDVADKVEALMTHLRLKPLEKKRLQKAFGDWRGHGPELANEAKGSWNQIPKLLRQAEIGQDVVLTAPQKYTSLKSSFSLSKATGLALSLAGS